MKNKTLLLADLSIRNEAVGGGAIPDDEMQCDFVISTGDRDGHYSYMADNTLRNFTAGAERGVPFMLDHQSNVNCQIGRTIAASFDESEKRVIATVSLLRDTEETPDNMRVNEYIRRIERGFYDSVSVGYRDATEICRIDNKPIWDFAIENPCPHIPGRTYNGQVCEYDVNDGKLREVSLVAAGSNPNAKLLDRAGWAESLRNVKTEGDLVAGVNDDAKSILERDGLKYREGLIAEAIKSGIRADDNFDEALWRERFKTYDAAFIIEQTATWDKLGDARWGTGGRKTEGGSPAVGNDDRVSLPAWLFG